MPSVYRFGKRWCVQVNEAPGRPRRFFRWKKHAEEFRLKLQIALDRRDRQKVQDLLHPRGRESINTLVKLWLMTGKPSRTEKQTQLKKTRLTDALTAMKIDAPGDLTLDAVTAYIHTRKSKEAAKTTNERVAILRGFSNWLFLSGRTDRDTLSLLQRVDSIRTYHRAALSVEDVAGIMAAAGVRSIVERRRDQPRASDATMARIRRMCERRQFLIAICFATGMRVDEVRRLTWADLRLDENEIVLPAARTKSRRRERVFVAPWLTRELKDLRDRAIQECGGIPDPQGRVVHVPNNAHVRVRRDAAYYGLDIDDPEAKVDLHCLRHSVATWLAEEGVDPHLADLFTRHAPQGSTRARTYLHGRAPTMHTIAGRIPDLFELMREMVSTSTDIGEHSCPRLLRHAPKKNQPKPPACGDLGQIDAS